MSDDKVSVCSYMWALQDPARTWKDLGRLIMPRSCKFLYLNLVKNMQELAKILEANAKNLMTWHLWTEWTRSGTFTRPVLFLIRLIWNKLMTTQSSLLDIILIISTLWLYIYIQLFAKILSPWYISVYKYIKCIVGRVPLENLLPARVMLINIQYLQYFDHEYLPVATCTCSWFVCAQKWFLKLKLSHNAVHICIYWYISRAQNFWKQYTSIRHCSRFFCRRFNRLPFVRAKEEV